MKGDKTQVRTPQIGPYPLQEKFKILFLGGYVYDVTNSKSGRPASGPREKKFKLKLEKNGSKSGRRASGPREKKSKLKLGKELGVIVGGGPRGPGRKSSSLN